MNRQVSQLVDCWAELNPEAAERGKGGETCATPYNSYTLPEVSASEEMGNVLELEFKMK